MEAPDRLFDRKLVGSPEGDLDGVADGISDSILVKSTKGEDEGVPDG